MKQMEIHISGNESWITATVEDRDGGVLGSSTAPVVEGATFDVRAAVIREAVEEALRDGGHCE